MHLPDGIINQPASLTFLAVSGAFVFWAAKEAKRQLFEKVKNLVPQLAMEFGSLSAPRISSYLKIRPEAKKIIPKLIAVFSLIYAVQLFDFPVINGVFGHLIGAALAGLVLGPALGILIIAAVLATQAIFFNDGGTMALGVNIFTMAVAGAGGGCLVYRLIKNYLSDNLSIFLAALLSVIGSALAFGLIMFISRQIIIGQLFSEILAPHMIIGLIEGILTVLVIKYLFPTSYKLPPTS